MDSIPLKFCKTCQTHKPATKEYFYCDVKTPDGWFIQCKDCKKAYQRQYHLEHKEHQNRNVREHYRLTADARKEYVKQWQRDNPDKAKAYRTKWRVENSETVNTYTRRYRARKRGFADALEPELWHRCLDYFNHCCAACGRQANDLFGTHTLAADHWIPLSSPDCLGTVPTNIVPLCHGIDGCNNSKSDSKPFDWLNRKFGKHKAKQILKRIEAYFEWIRQQTAE